MEFTELNRKCTIYGSPWTPKYGKSAFQYPRDDDIWMEGKKIPKDIDILLTHGPSYGRLDGAFHSGCRYLAQAIEERRPRLVVCGHVHVGHGKKKVQFDRLRRFYEDVERGWSGWEVIPMMVLLLLWTRVSATFGSAVGLRKADRCTELINAAVVGVDNKFCNDAVVTYIYIGRASTGNMKKFISDSRRCQSCRLKLSFELELEAELFTEIGS